MKLGLCFFAMVMSPILYGNDFVDGANLSGTINIDNEDCAIISPLTNNNLLIFEAGVIPSFGATGTHVLHVNTGSGYVPRISLVGNVDVIGLSTTDGNLSNQVTLKAINASVREVSNDAIEMDQESGSDYSFKETLFFQTGLSYENYLPGSLSATASVLVECVSE